MNASTTNNEFFSISSQLYVRLRRVTGRVVDAIHMGENQAYAMHVIQLALMIEDAELQRYATRLLDFLEPEIAQLQITEQKKDSELIQAMPSEKTFEDGKLKTDTDSLADTIDSESTPDEIYKAEVSHHYIGALR